MEGGVTSRLGGLDDLGRSESSGSTADWLGLPGEGEADLVEAGGVVGGFGKT